MLLKVEKNNKMCGLNFRWVYLLRVLKKFLHSGETLHCPAATGGTMKYVVSPGLEPQTFCV